MKNDCLSSIRHSLEKLPDGALQIEYDNPTGLPPFLDLHAKTKGKGRMRVYHPFPGIQLSFDCCLADEISFHHSPLSSVLEMAYCRQGRAGWNMANGTCVYLGAGDLAVHSMDCCGDSVMMFPLGYFQGISVSVDLNQLSLSMPEILLEAGLQPETLQQTYCGPDRSAVIAANPDLECIFLPLFRLFPEPSGNSEEQGNSRFLLSYLQLKLQELLLYVSLYRPRQEKIFPCSHSQARLIQEIHGQITDDLSRRWTIEELSRRYLLNTSSLKKLFKAVYGLPIATYMRNFRIQRAMELLQDTDETIASVAAQVGYETQGKFTRTFKEITGESPSEYRRHHRIKEKILL